MKIALVGNPNSGKTTLYNGLTGQKESAGNWSGVTVSEKSAAIKAKYLSGKKTMTLVDLPGAYSVSPYTTEEAITRDAIENKDFSAILNIVDGANFERSLFMTTQLSELGIPMIVAINKKDILDARGDTIDLKSLSEGLNCPVVVIQADRQSGLADLMKVIVTRIESENPQKPAGNIMEGATLSDEGRQGIVRTILDNSWHQGEDRNQIRWSDRLDGVLAHKWFGLPIFFLVMWAVYGISIEGPGGMINGFLNDTLFGEWIPAYAETLLSTWAVSPLLKDLIINGVIGGVGAVIGFLPLIMFLFFSLALLEDSGYMARVAVVMDRYFKKIGLSGKSIIPMIVGSGCGIPGVMATRTIEDVNERRATIMLTTFVPCGAKLPIIALFSAVFFPNSSWVGPSMYLLSIAVIIAGGLLLKQVFVWENQAPFIMELPEYKIPSIRYAFRQMMRQASGFIYKASTIILLMNTLVWFLQAYGFDFNPVSDQSASMLAAFGGWIAPILIPLGFVGWQLAAASVTGFIAKENVVGTFAVLLAVASEEALMAPHGIMTTLFTPVTAYAYLVFNLFTPPCFAAIGAMNAEMDSRKWMLRALVFQFSVGYTLAMIISQVGSLVFYGKPAEGWLPALLILVFGATGLVLRIQSVHKKKQLQSERWLQERMSN